MRRAGLLLLVFLLLPAGCFRSSNGNDTGEAPAAAETSGETGDSEEDTNLPPPPNVDRFGNGVLQRFAIREIPGGIDELISQTGEGWTRVLLNNISDLGPLSGLTALSGLSLQDNAISDLSPLLANSGLGADDAISLRDNPIDCADQADNIQALLDRGVDLYVPQCP